MQGAASDRANSPRRPLGKGQRASKQAGVSSFKTKGGARTLRFVNADSASERACSRGQGSGLVFPTCGVGKTKRRANHGRLLGLRSSLFQFYALVVPGADARQEKLRGLEDQLGADRERLSAQAAETERAAARAAQAEARARSFEAEGEAAKQVRRLARVRVSPSDWGRLLATSAVAD